MPDPKALILLVEDEPIIRWIVFEGLEAEGYEVIEAANADQAFAILNTRSDVGVLFTDVNMPGHIDGLDLVELVHAKWPDIRLVVTSARDLERCVPDDGAFLTKPYSLSDMTAKIKAATG